MKNMTKDQFNLYIENLLQKFAFHPTYIEEDFLVKLKHENRRFIKQIIDDYILNESHIIRNLPFFENCINSDLEEFLFKEIFSKCQTFFSSAIDKNNLIKESFSEPDIELLIELHKIFIPQSNHRQFLYPNLEQFLKQQLRFFIQQNLYQTYKKGTTPNKTLQTLKMMEILEKTIQMIIQKLSELEDLHLDLWKKQKIILNSHFLISFQYIPSQLRLKVINNSKQLNSWKKNFGFDINNRGEGSNSILNSDLPPGFQNLPVDTQYFSRSFKHACLTALTQYDSLEQLLNGILIKSENAQALRFLIPKYHNKIKCIYIDPPYNTQNTNLLFNDAFSHHSWQVMMRNRLEIAKNLLNEEGMIFVSIDNNEYANLFHLMTEIFGENNFIETFLWEKTATPPSLSMKSRKTTEYVLCFEKKRTKIKYKGPLQEGGDAPLLNRDNPLKKIQFPPRSIKTKLKDGIYPAKKYHRTTLVNNAEVKNGYITNQVEMIFPSKWSQETVNKEITIGTQFIIKSKRFSIRYIRNNGINFNRPKNFLTSKYTTPRITKSNQKVGTNEESFKEIAQMGIDFTDYPKPVSLIKYLLSFNTDENDIILDFFAGSGTTGHAVMDLNQDELRNGQRKFILIEKADYFENILKNRILKRMYASKWNNKKPSELVQDPICIQYFTLDNYNKNLTLFLPPEKEKDSFPYIIPNLYEKIRINPKIVYNPFIPRKLPKDNLYSKTDLIDTFNYWLGIQITTWQVIKTEPNLNLIKINAIDTQNQKIIIFWLWNDENIEHERIKEILTNLLQKESDYGQVFINKSNFLPNAQLIIDKFQELHYPNS